MQSDPTAAQFIKRLHARRSAAELKKYHRYFSFDEGKPGGDRFIGVRMGQVFALAREFLGMPIDEIEKLMESPVHEARAGAMSIMGRQASDRKTPEERLKELYKLYMRRHDRINNWDLVDLAAHHVVGRYLSDKPRRILYKLARSKSRWERRTAIVSTAYFIRQGDVEDAFRIAELLVKDSEDLVHKATGWMLRFAGDKDRARLVRFLNKNASRMPRVMLRYAMEHFGRKDRDAYLSLGKDGERHR